MVFYGPYTVFAQASYLLTCQHANTTWSQGSLGKACRLTVTDSHSLLCFFSGVYCRILKGSGILGSGILSSRTQMYSIDACQKGLCRHEAHEYNAKLEDTWRSSL